MILGRPRYFRLWRDLALHGHHSVGMFAVMASLCRLAARQGFPFGLPRLRRAVFLAAIGVMLVSPLAICWQLRWPSFTAIRLRCCAPA
jgi:hypothetical protein